jgi:hypothetical protein
MFAESSLPVFAASAVIRFALASASERMTSASASASATSFNPSTSNRFTAFLQKKCAKRTNPHTDCNKMSVENQGGLSQFCTLLFFFPQICIKIKMEREMKKKKMKSWINLQEWNKH